MPAACLQMSSDWRLPAINAGPAQHSLKLKVHVSSAHAGVPCLCLYCLVRSLQVFGMPLLARNHRNGPAWLTEAGQVLLPYCRSMLAVASEACKAMQEYQAASVSVVSLGASQTVGTYVMPRLVAAFKRNNSQVRWRWLSLHVCLHVRRAWCLPSSLVMSRCVVA